MKFLRYNFWRLRHDTKPSLRFTKELWKQLDQAWSRRYPSPVRWYRTVWARFSIIMSTVALVTSSFGAAAYAYASPEVTDGMVLYPVKTSIENFQEKLQRTPEAKAKFYLKQIARREAEKKVLERRRHNIAQIENQIQSVEIRLENTNKQLEKIGDQSDALHQQVQKRLLERMERLEKRQIQLNDKKVNLEKINRRFTPSLGVRQNRGEAARVGEE